MFDLATLDTSAKAETGFTLEIEHPGTGDSLGMSVTVAGKDSSIYRKAQTALLRKHAGLRRQTPKPEETRVEACRLLAACTLGWSGVVVDGAELPCTAENAASLYQRFSWLYEQVDMAIHDRGNYLSD